MGIQAPPDGDAEVRLVLHLPWDVVAALGQEVSRPGGPDTAAGEPRRGGQPRLRHGTAQTAGVHAKPERERNQPTPTASHLTPGAGGRSPVSRPGRRSRRSTAARRTVAQRRANGSAEESTGPQHTTSAPDPGPARCRGILERPTRATER
ncbi:hypothetical protein ACFQ10_53565 [Streptomyces indonesiensis]